MEVSSNAPNHNSPWKYLAKTAANGGEFEAEHQKQMEEMIIQDQHNKNFRIWSRIEEDLVNFGFGVLEEFERMWRVFGSDLEKCVILL
jgi:hypothetical protein